MMCYSIKNKKFPTAFSLLILMFLHTRASQQFFTVDIHVFRHGPPQAMTKLKFLLLLIFFLIFHMFSFAKSATIFLFYVNASHVIYISYLFAHYMYVTQHFSVDPMYSRNGPMRVHLDPV